MLGEKRRNRALFCSHALVACRGSTGWLMRQYGLEPSPGQFLLTGKIQGNSTDPTFAASVRARRAVEPGLLLTFPYARKQGICQSKQGKPNRERGISERFWEFIWSFVRSVRIAHAQCIYVEGERCSSLLGHVCFLSQSGLDEHPRRTSVIDPHRHKASHSSAMRGLRRRHSFWLSRLSKALTLVARRRRPPNGGQNSKALSKPSWTQAETS